MDILTTITNWLTAHKPQPIEINLPEIQFLEARPITPANRTHRLSAPSTSQLVENAALMLAGLGIPELKQFAAIIVAMAIKSDDYNDAIQDGVLGILTALKRGKPERENRTIWLVRAAQAAIVGNIRRIVENGVPESLDVSTPDGEGMDELLSDDEQDMQERYIDTADESIVNRCVTQLVADGMPLHEAWKRVAILLDEFSQPNEVTDDAVRGGDKTGGKFVYKFQAPERMEGQSFGTTADDEDDGVFFDNRDNPDDNAGAADFWSRDINLDLESLEEVYAKWRKNDATGKWANMNPVRGLDGKWTNFSDRVEQEFNGEYFDDGENRQNDDELDDIDSLEAAQAKELGISLNELLNGELDAVSPRFNRPESAKLTKALDAFLAGIKTEGPAYWQQAGYIREAVQAIMSGFGKDAADALAFKRWHQAEFAKAMAEIASLPEDKRETEAKAAEKRWYAANRQPLAPVVKMTTVNGVPSAFTLSDGVVLPVADAWKQWDVVTPSGAVKEFVAKLRQAADAAETKLLAGKAELANDEKSALRNVRKLAGLMSQLRD